jgi:oligopeptide transport system substrate-binding protein
MKKPLFTALCLLIATGTLYAAGGSQASGSSGGAAKPEFVIGNGTEIQSIDPSPIEGVPEHRVYMALFEGLVVNDPKTNKAQPGVAESWTISADGSVITFKIRSGITWSDGTPIIAQTVVDS